ncbi:hypothetical protein E4L96_15585 [Massilia arenosa]|uniref:Cysteine-rich CWC family protein n=1 Tax=Zemynaea arenosa TaxID=2561931 RepID=A0A4Y9S5M8_9BURK|nr:hypothetical protein E4L96_15585 [Massilia arenosa]
MQRCGRCGAELHCAMAAGDAAPCWCTELPPAVPVPSGPTGTGAADAACWCRACLTAHIASLQRPHD